MPKFSRKFQSKNGRSIPVRKIYVNAVKNYPTDRNIITTVFQQYGKIQEVQMSPAKIFFFVTFKDPTSAARALSHKAILENTRKYMVQPANQWRQPVELSGGTIVWDRRANEKEIGQPADLDMSVGSRQDPTKPSLLDLNDDCLRIILSHFSLPQLIGIERVCKRIRTISMEIWNRVNSLDFKHKFQHPGVSCVENFREVLLRCGSTLKSLDLSHVKDLNLYECSRQMDELCTVLEELDLSFFKLDKHGLEPLEVILSTLRTLKFNCVKYEDRFKWPWQMEAVPNLKHLEIYVEPQQDYSLIPSSVEVLHISLNLGFDLDINKLTSLKNLRVLHTYNKICGTELNTFPNLEELVCGDLYFERSKHSTELRKLKSLSIYAASSTRSLDKIILKCPYLTELSITSSSEATLETGWGNTISALKHLNRLSLKHVLFEEGIFHEMVNNCNGLLVKFSCHGCDGISVDDLLRMLVYNPQMTQLDISSAGFDEVSFIKKARKIVEAESHVQLTIHTLCVEEKIMDKFLRDPYIILMGLKQCEFCDWDALYQLP